MIELKAQPALLCGTASRISAKEKQDGMELRARPAILRAVIQITRASTGKVEEYVITGTPTEDQP